MRSEIWRRIEGIEAELKAIKQLLAQLDESELTPSEKQQRAVDKWLEFLGEVSGK